mgnify:CR=1 FL=1
MWYHVFTQEEDDMTAYEKGWKACEAGKIMTANPYELFGRNAETDKSLQWFRDLRAEWFRGWKESSYQNS